MRNSKRNAKALSILAAAAGLTSVVQFAHATPPSFTWNNSTTGNWSVGNNWIGGTAPNANGDPTYDLLFRNSGAAYTATNDLGAFNLAVLRFNNTGANAINLAGNQINLPGNTTSVNFIGGAGAVNIANNVAVGGNGFTQPSTITNSVATTSALTFTGALSSTVANVGENGGALNIDRATGATNINAGGSLYALRINQGLVTQNGGSLFLTSTQREGDENVQGAPITDSTPGYWALGVGTSTNSASTFTMNGGVLRAESGFAALAEGSKGTMNFTNAAVATFLAQGAISGGRWGVLAGDGTINILSGSKVTNRLTDLGRELNANINPNSFLNIDGAGSSLNTTQVIASRNGGNATINISAGAQLNVSTGQFVLASAADTAGSPFPGDGRLTVTGAGSQLNVPGNATFFAASGNGTFTVSNGGVATLATQFNVGGISGGNGTLIIDNGTVNAVANTFQGGEGDPAGGGTILISNGGSYHGTGQYVMGSVTQPDLISVTNGTMTFDATGANNTFLSTGTNDKSVITVSGPNAHVVATGTNQQFLTGGGSAGATNGVATITVNNGGEMALNSTGTLIWSSNPGSKTTILVNGAGSRMTGGLDTRLADDVSDATMTINGGATASFGGAMRMGTTGDGSTAGHGVLVVDGAGSKLTTGGFVQSGLYVDNVGTELEGGNSTITVSNGGQIVTGFDLEGNRAAIGGGQGEAAISVTGAGSKITFDSGLADGTGANAFGDLEVGFHAGTNATLTIGAGASVLINKGTGTNLGSSQFASAGGLDARATITNAGTLTMGDDAVHGWDGQATLTNSGTISAHTLTLGINGIASNSLHGAGTINNSGTITVEDELDAGLLGLASISTTGRINVGSNMFAGALAGTQSHGNIAVNGGILTVGGQAQIGGAGGTLGGASTLSITNNGAATIGTGTAGLLAVYQTSTVSIGSGAVAGRLTVNGDTGVDGHVFYNSGTFKTTGGLEVDGEVRLTSAARDVNGNPTNKKTLEAGSLSFAGISGTGTNTIVTGGIVDLNDNDALFHGNTLSGNGSLDVAMQIRSGRNGGTWNGQGIISTAAALNASKHTGLGAISGADYKSASSHAGTTSFNGLPLANTDTVVKYTYNGDADLNGSITGADYSKIDTTFNNEHTAGNIGGWFNGDFNYDGKVDGQDYGLIDAAFNIQKAPPVVTFGRGDVWVGQSTFASTGMDGADAMSATLGRATDKHGVASALNTDPANMVGPMGVGSDLGNAGVAVPEPSVLGLVGISLLGAFSRRRRAAR